MTGILTVYQANAPTLTPFSKADVRDRDYNPGPIHFMFGSGFSGTALFSVRTNPRWRRLR